MYTELLYIRANLVRVLDAHNELPAGALGEQIVEQRGAQTAEVQVACGARSIADTHC